MFCKKLKHTVVNNRPYPSMKWKWQQSKLSNSVVLCQNQSILSPLEKNHDVVGSSLFSQCTQTFEEPLREVYFINWLSSVLKFILIAVLILLLLPNDHHTASAFKHLDTSVIQLYKYIYILWNKPWICSSALFYLKFLFFSQLLLPAHL